MSEAIELTPTPATGRSPRDIRLAIGGAVLYLAFYAGMTAFNAHHPALPPLVWAALAPLTSVAYLIIMVTAIRLLCHLTLTARQETPLMGLALALFLILNPYVRYTAVQMVHGRRFIEAVGTLSRVQSNPLLDILVPFLLILTGVFFGQLLSRIVRERALLVPVALVAGMIDFWGVYWGFVSFATEKANAAVSTMAAAATAAATVPDAVKASLPPQFAVFGNIAPPENIGIGDFVFIAFFLTCAIRLGLNPRRTAGGIILGMLLASIIMALDKTTVFGIAVSISYLPGLVFICGGVLLANLRAWKLTRPEWAMTGVIVGFLAILISITVVRDVQAKRAAARNAPKTSVTAFTLPQPTPRAAITAALAVITPKSSAATLLPIHIRCAFTGRAVQGWALIALVRPAQRTIQPATEIVLNAIPQQGKPGWQVTNQLSCPPSVITYQFINAGLPKPQRSSDPTTLLRKAEPIPLAALAIFDHPETCFAELPSEPTVMVGLLPHTAFVAGKRKKAYKELPLAQLLDE